MRFARAIVSCSVLAAAAGAAVLAACNPSASAPADAGPHVVGKGRDEIGKYLLATAGCHDCHTPGAMEGHMPGEAEYVTGSPLGWQGPWGTSYAQNLRLKLRGYPSEEVFVKAMKARATSPTMARPPMPWASLVAMSDADLGAIYTYIRGLGEAGQPMPDALPPGVEPVGPYVVVAPPQIGKGPAK
jgi:hypothetical protein